jgi:ribonuclease BN (tRNA processing enzyme)
VLLTVLGCSGSVPGPHSPASGYLVEYDGVRLAVDLGNGTLGALQALQDPFALDAVLFSHLHPDHCADFAALTVHRRYHPNRPYDPTVRRLPVYGPSDAPSRLAAQYAPNAAELAETDLSDVYDFRAWDDTPVEIGPFRITAGRVDHPCEAYGLRIEADERVLAYTGDTGVCPALDTLADGANALLSEATWTHADDRPAGLHLSGRQAGELASRAGVGNLLLTHIAPWTDQDAVLAEATDAFFGPISLARPAETHRI